MIRNVVMGRLIDDADEAQVEAGLAGITGLRSPGMLACSLGRDIGLRAGGWSFAIVNDWTDADAYHAYDVDEEHNRYRKLLADNCAEIARVQFEI